MSNYRNDREIADIFKALSNPHRLTIFNQLRQCCAPGTRCNLETQERRCISDLGESLNIAASTLSHHIKELNRAGLLQTQRHGKNIECWVEPAILDELSNYFKR